MPSEEIELRSVLTEIANQSPDGHDRVLVYLERKALEEAKEAKHRRELERSDNYRSWAGLILGFIIGCFAFALAAYGFWLGAYIESAGVVGVSFAANTGVFITGKYLAAKEQSDKTPVE